jgi:hypothetical protein
MWEVMGPMIASTYSGGMQATTATADRQPGSAVEHLREWRAAHVYRQTPLAAEVTLQELRIETFFPADEASERVWKRVTSE